MVTQAEQRGLPILGSYAAKTCARAIHNQYDATIEAPPYEVPESLQRLFDSGNEHERAVFEAWTIARPDLVNLLALDQREAPSREAKEAHIAATVDAMRRQAPIILGGRLPDDVSGGRGGKPDVLLLDPSSGGYHPADVKAHHVLISGDGAIVSSLADPAYVAASPAPFAVRKRGEDDVIQLAHYWRMLEACGFNAAMPYGAIIGNDPGETYQLTWHDLSAPLFTTFSRTNGKTVRSALARHDHEHAFRLKVATRARERTGDVDDPPPLVEPLGQEDCASCMWAPVCIDILPAGDLSRELRDTLSVREYLALRAQGVLTVDDLANADTDALLASEYADETTHVRLRAQRLRKAHVSAQLCRDGDVLRLIPGASIDLPSADVEIDIDTEWDRTNRVYLWGLMVTTYGQSKYVQFSDLSILNDEAERALARRCFDWIAGRHPDAVVFHYSSAEANQARRILGEGIHDYDGTAASPDCWYDLLAVVRSCMESRRGLGLKVVASEAAGFHWRDETPGGLESQAWLDAARAGDSKSWQRILTYNEDDVRASLAIRRFLRVNS
jgi:predicted RecB family nuclease